MIITNFNPYDAKKKLYLGEPKGFATATHNLKWAKLSHICLIWNRTRANVDV